MINYNTISLLLVLIILIMCTQNFHKKKVISKKHKPIRKLTFKRCKEDTIGMDPFVAKLFIDHNISKDNNKWDIYYPCSYNQIEKELALIKPTNNKQIIFGISGTDYIVSKNGIWELLFNKYKKDATKVMPQTYILHNKRDMQVFRNNYNPNKIYILKKNLQRKEGIKITQDIYEIMNASKKEFRIVQEYKVNTFLINKRKINLRIYVLITAIHGKIEAFIHQNGKIIYTNKNYNPNTLTDLESNLTSINLNQNIYNKNPLSYNDFLNYLKQNKYNSEVVNNNVYDVITKVMHASHHKLGKMKSLQNNLCFQLYGIDIFFDDKLNPYILEFNKGPDMRPKNYRDKILKSKVKYDMFEHVKIIEDNNPKYINKFIRIY
jgi:hypothetical protein